LSISWDTVSGADNYRLERISYNENDWKEIYFGTNPSFYDDGVIPSKTYSYRVYTISGGIVSNPSPVKLGTAPAQFPNTPTGITIITLDANSVQFIWGDVKYAQFYHIERYDSKKKDWVEIAQTTVASFTDTKLQPTTTYSYRIRAENGGLKSDYAEITIATLGPAPKAPTSVKGVAQGNSVVLTWKSANGATAYHVEYSLDGKTNWETVLFSSPTSTGGTITDLEYCTKYYFRVYSMSDSGQSEKPSSTINITTPPETPEHLTLTNITDKTATLTWDAVVNATGYRIEKFVNNKWSSAGSAKANVTEFTVKSLKALTDYKFRVIALNKSVKSETSNEVAVTTPYAMTTTITKSGFALTNGNDFAFMFSGKTPVSNNQTLKNETFQYELIVSASTKTDKNTGELLKTESISLGTISITLSPDGKTYTTEPILFNKLGTIPNVNLTTLKTIQFQLKVTNPTSSSTFQQASTFYTKVAKLTLPKWFV
jgi:fibronectin type 3 domain-containing protein